jgi:putative membrane protein
MSWLVPVMLGTVLLAGYGFALWRRRVTLPPWSPWRIAAWAGGVALVVLALAPPLMDGARHDHRLHMAQHLLLGMYAPLGLVLGAPAMLLLGSVPHGAGLTLSRVLRSRPLRVLAHPVTAAVLSAGGLFALYLTPVYQAALSRPVIGGFVLAHLLLAGYLYTWAIAGPDPGPHRPGLAMRITVVIVAAGAHAFLAKLLYAGAAEHAVTEGHQSTMATAAHMMYYGGDGAEVLLVVMLLARWYRRRAPVGAGGAHHDVAPVRSDPRQRQRATRRTIVEP